MSDPNLIPLHPEEPNTFTQNYAAAEEAAIKGNDIRSQAAIRRAAGTVLVEALENDVDPSTLQSDETVGGLAALNDGGDDSNYAYRLKQKAIRMARDKAELAGLRASGVSERTVIATQMLTKEKDTLSKQADVVEQTVLGKYTEKNDEELRDPKLLASPAGREYVTQVLLKRLH